MRGGVFQCTLDCPFADVLVFPSIPGPTMPQSPEYNIEDLHLAPQTTRL